MPTQCLWVSKYLRCAVRRIKVKQNIKWVRKNAKLRRTKAVWSFGQWLQGDGRHFNELYRVVSVQFLEMSLPNDIPLSAVHCCIGELEINSFHYSFLPVCISSQQQDNFVVAFLTSLSQVNHFLVQISNKSERKVAYLLISENRYWLFFLVVVFLKIVYLRIHKKKTLHNSCRLLKEFDVLGVLVWRNLH